MSVSRGMAAALLTIPLLLSACLGPTDLREDFQESIPEPEERVIQEERRFEAAVSGIIVNPNNPSRISPESVFHLPADTTSLNLSFTWQTPVNDYTFVLEHPGGEDRYELESGLPTDSFSLELEYDEPTPGMYNAYLIAEYLLLEDEIALDAEWVRVVTVFKGGVEEAQYPGSVTVTRDGDAWRATMGYQTTGAVDALVDMDVNTFNGRVEVIHTRNDEATIRVEPWARADSEDRAEELVRSILVTMTAEDETLKAHAKKSGSVSTNGSESIGATVKIEVPADVRGSVKTSNGRITLDDLVLSDLHAKSSNGRIEATGQTSGSLDLETSNGRIKADLKGDGDVDLDTSNGRIELAFEPTGDTTLGAKSSNGRIKFELTETSGIGYDIDAKTSNSEISEDMDEASLDGDDKDATLQTSGFADRSIQVTGNADTSNGKIEFIGN